MKRFICVYKTGGRFIEDDVKLLASAIKDNCVGPHEIICLSDTVTRSVTKGNVRYLPLKFDFPGWWSKLELFRPCFLKMRPMMYLDLDTAIVGDLSGIYNKLRDEDVHFAMLEDFHHKERDGASGVMWLGRGDEGQDEDFDKVWFSFKGNSEEVMNEYKASGPVTKQGDQCFITSVLKPDIHLQEMFPESFYSFKPERDQFLHVLPRTAKVICFHGKPCIREAARTVNWVSIYTRGYSHRYYASYNKKHKGTLIIVGSADKELKDYKKAIKKRKDAKVMVIGHAAGMVKADFVVTDHYEVHEQLRILQNEFHEDYTTHCTLCSAPSRYSDVVDYWWDWTRSDCSSVHTAIRIGLACGFDEIILCGSPLEHGKIQHPKQVEKDGEQWPPPRDLNRFKSDPGNDSSEEILETFRKNFKSHVPEWEGRVFSMSGYTKKLLGAPDGLKR